MIADPKAMALDARVEARGEFLDARMKLIIAILKERGVGSKSDMRLDILREVESAIWVDHIQSIGLVDTALNMITEEASRPKHTFTAKKIDAKFYLTDDFPKKEGEFL